MANTLFIGEAVEYTPPNLEKGIPAIIRFKVKKTIRGTREKEFRVFWTNGTFGESKSLADFKSTYGALTKVGIVLPDTYLKKCREVDIESAAGKKSKGMSCNWEVLAEPVVGSENLPWVLQGRCTPPYMESEEPRPLLE